MARGSQSNFPQALQPIRCSIRPGLICCRGVRARVSAQTCEKGRPRLRLRHRWGRARSWQASCAHQRVSSVAPRARAAVWRPSLGCPLGRSLPRLPVGWRGLARGLCAYLPMVVRPGSTQLSGFEVRFLVSGPAARGYAPAAAGCRPRAEHPRRQPATTVADADAAAPRRRRQLPRRRRRRRRRRPRRRHRHRHRRHPTHRRRRRRRRSHYPRRRHRRRRRSRSRSRRRRRRRHRPCRHSRRRRPAPCPVPRTRTPRAHVTVAAAVAAGDDAASAAAEEADDAERPTPPMPPLMPRGMDADAAMPMPGSGGSRA